MSKSYHEILWNITVKLNFTWQTTTEQLFLKVLKKFWKFRNFALWINLCLSLSELVKLRHWCHSRLLLKVATLTTLKLLQPFFRNNAFISYHSVLLNHCVHFHQIWGIPPLSLLVTTYFNKKNIRLP